MIKTVEEQENESSAFLWMKDTPVMLVSCVTKPGENVLLISILHEVPVICTELHQNINQFTTLWSIR